MHETRGHYSVCNDESSKSVCIWKMNKIGPKCVDNSLSLIRLSMRINNDRQSLDREASENGLAEVIWFPILGCVL